MDRADLIDAACIGLGIALLLFQIVEGEGYLFSSLWAPFLMLALGAIVIFRSGEIFVESSISLASRLGISQTTVGFTLVAISTSLPEILVSPIASHLGSPSISVGNVLGANIADLTLVLGAGLLAGGRILTEDRSTRDVLLFILVAALMIPFLIDGTFTKFEAAIMFALYVAYWALTTRKGGEVPGEARVSPWLFLPSSLAIFGSSRVLVSAVRGISFQTGLSQLSLAATLVSLMTTLPELVTSLLAARKGYGGLALGNAVGSGIANACLGLTLATLFGPVSWSPRPWMLLLHLLVGLTVFLLTRLGALNRRAGVALLLLYLGFAVAVYLR